MNDNDPGNRCASCDSLVTQLEPYRAITEEEMRAYPHLPSSAFVSNVECPNCGHSGLGVHWKALRICSDRASQ